MNTNAIAQLSWPDLVAPVWFTICWLGYSLYADRTRKVTLMKLMSRYRLAWMRAMVRRDNRIVDAQVTQLLVHNIAFFTSASILIVGGLIAVLGAAERARAVLDELPFSQETPTLLLDIKILLLIVVFVYAFFKFTWSLRQFNHVAILIAAAPEKSEPLHPEADDHAALAAAVASQAGNHFNKAMRAYYFGLGALGWLLSPWLFMLTSASVVLVNWRREFRGDARELLIRRHGQEHALHASEHRPIPEQPGSR